MSNPKLLEIPADLKGMIVCSPEAGMRATDTRRTKFYELLNAGEFQSYMDGPRRKIVVASLVEYVRRRIEAANTEAV